MKPVALARDFKPLETPAGFYTFGKNGVWRNGMCQNEKGFRLSAAVIPYQYIGVIETDTFPIIFSTNNTFSAFGFYDDVKDIYVPIENDQAKSYKLNFRTDKFIKGEARRNYLNHIEIAWLDKFNPVRFADTENIPIELSGFLLFPESFEPDITLELLNGGTLLLGAYYVAAKYINSDGTETRYSTAEGPIFTVAPNFNAIPGGNTGKSIRITITKVDPRYKSIQIAVIRKIKGITTVRELPSAPVTDTLTLIYTGSEGEDITLEEALIPAAFYRNASSITQLNDTLYLADIKEAAVYNLQKYASLVKLSWKSDFRADIDTDESVRSGKLRTFKHGEAYAFYIVYSLSNGQKTEAYHCVGPPSGNALLPDINISIAKKYQADTIGMANVNTSERTGDTGVWVNENEFYPNTDDFNSINIGGEDLRGQQVRHHKMPTLNQMKSLFYSNEPEYGVTGLDVLGIKANNVIIPAELIGVVTGYEVYYAKRDYSNVTILSQGLVINGATSGYTANDVYFTGGNFNSRILRSTGTRTNAHAARFFNLQNTAFKIHHPDLMVNKPAITPAFLASNYKLEAYNEMITNTVDELNTVYDYTRGKAYSNTSYLREIIKDTGYLANNATKGNIKNTKAEDGFVGTFTDGIGFPITIWDWVHGGRDTEGNSSAASYEQAHLVDVIVLKTDLFRSFSTQDLVRTGIINNINAGIANQYAFGGDTFLVYHSYSGYGLVDSADKYASQPGRVDGINNSTEETYTDEFYLGTSGNKVLRRYVTESSMNLWQRFEDPLLPASKFWPASGKEILNGMDRNKDNNTIALSQEANSIADVLNGISVYNPDKVTIVNSPYKVIRSNKQSKEGKINSWKNFNPLDYYEADKNMGPIVNLQGFNDRLIIHHQNALYLTQDKTTLQGDILSVTLGTGDIFRIPPQQGKPSKSGYGGTQHQLACVLTDFGYIFPDAQTGIIFVLNDDGLNPINAGIDTFLQEYLNIKEINPFIGNGITIGYDQQLKRILITVKNLNQANSNYVPNYEETPEFFAKLIPNVSIVFRQGRYQLFKGVNTSSYPCITFSAPVLGDYDFTIPEDKPTGFYIGQVIAAGDVPLSYLIYSGNTSNAFMIDSATGKIYVQTRAALNVLIKVLFTLVIKVTDKRGASDTGIVTINLTAINKPPITQDYQLMVAENTPTDTALQIVAASDPKGLALTYTLEFESVIGALKVSAVNGQLSVNDGAKLNYDATPFIDAKVRVSNGILYAISTIRITLLNILEPPTAVSNAVTIPSTATGDLITFNTAVDPDGGPIIYTLISQSVPGMFAVNLVTKVISLIPGQIITEGSTYVINIRATDEDGQFIDYTATITVIAIVTTPCGNSAAYNGGEAFPAEVVITLGSSLGNVQLTFDAISVPDKFQVFHNGVMVIDTGYRGTASQQGALDSALAARGLPSEAIVALGSGIISFTKTSTVSTAIVKVYAPLAGTAWNFTLACPV